MSQVRPRKGLGAMPMESPGQDPPASSPPQVAEEKIDGNDPLLDLDQLEELHDEAERMKALGNKHMAAQVC